MKKIYLIIIGTIVLLGLGIYYFYLVLPKAEISEAQVYKIQSDDKYPKFLEVSLDPQDVKVGDIQKMKVIVEDSSGIKSVTAEIEHDTGKDKVELSLKSKDQSREEWQGTWQVHSTHSKTYHTTFIANSLDGNQNSITLAWTDPCSIPNGGNWTLDGNCTISEVNGVDNGDFTVSGGYTLTILNGVTFAWNNGKSIFISNGNVAINTGSQLKQTNLWMTDADNDAYPPNATQYAQDTAPTNAKRRNLFIKDTYDCNDGNATVYPGIVCSSCNLCLDSGNCEIKTTTWGAGTYGCTGSNQRCYGGVCRSCDGYLYSDGCSGCAGQGGLACWRMGGDGESCDSGCAGYGGCIAANWDDSTGCVRIEQLVDCYACGGRTSWSSSPHRGETGWCYYRGTGANQWCSQEVLAGFRRMCVCQY